MDDVQTDVSPVSSTGSEQTAEELKVQLEAARSENANLKNHLRDKEEKKAIKTQPSEESTAELQQLKEEVAELKRAKEAQTQNLEQPLLEWAYQDQDLGKYYSPSADKDGQNYIRLSRTMKDLERENPLIAIDAKSRQDAMLKAHEINKIKYGWDAKPKTADTVAGATAGQQKSMASGSGSTMSTGEDPFAGIPESEASSYRELGLSPERVAELQKKYGQPLV